MDLVIIFLPMHAWTENRKCPRWYEMASKRFKFSAGHLELNMNFALFLGECPMSCPHMLYAAFLIYFSDKELAADGFSN